MGVALLFFLSPLIIHELGHWMALRRYRIPVREVGLGFGPRIFRYRRFSVRLLLIGAFVLPEPGPFQAAAPAERLWVALAGPAANFLYAGVLMLAGLLQGAGTPAARGLLAVAALNWALGWLNLIPIPPLDGWVVLESSLRMMGFTPSERWVHWTRRIGSALLYGIGALLLLWLIHPSPTLDEIF